MSKKTLYSRNISAFVALMLTSSCAGTIEKIENVGKAPEMRPLNNPVEQTGYSPLTWPTPIEPTEKEHNPGSLWATGAKSFFKDQRATRTGDIVTVTISIADQANLTNKSSRTRTNKDNLAAPNFLGLEKTATKILPGDPQLDSLVSITGDTNTEGDGQIDRKEEIKLKIAAIVTQVLPNGNLVIHGSQDVRVNYEVRQVSIDGVVRPQDIDSDNSINSDQIAEARILYGGKGTISDLQQPRYGSQIIDILSPF